jgi:hypothetical protein
MYCTASSFITHNPVRPSANNRNEHSSTMWRIVYSSAPQSPQSQGDDSTNPHLCMRCTHLPCSIRKRFNNTQLCRRMSKPGGRTLGSTIRSPLTDIDAVHAAVQGSGIEKSVVDGCGSKFYTNLRESILWSGISNICSYRRELACLLQFTSSRTVVASRHRFGEAMFASTSSPTTVPEINRIVLSSCISILLVRTLFNLAEPSIQQSNKQAPMKQFVMFQRLLPSLCQSGSPSS